jgi:hypothetical protein
LFLLLLHLFGVLGGCLVLFYCFGAHNMVGRREGNGNGYMH